MDVSNVCFGRFGIFSDRNEHLYVSIDTEAGILINIPLSKKSISSTSVLKSNATIGHLQHRSRIWFLMHWNARGRCNSKEIFQLVDSARLCSILDNFNGFSHGDSFTKQ
jgi:hypothetical protein